MAKKTRLPEEILDDIRNACALFGWLMAIDESKTDTVNGLIIGTEEYVETMTEKIGAERFSIYDPGKFTKGEH